MSEAARSDGTRGDAGTKPARQSVRQTAVLTIVLVAYLMIVLDISIVITALPKIQTGLGFTAVGLSWVQSAYTLAFGGLLLLGARAGDILGRRLMLVVGLGLFTTASLAVGAAQSAAVLIGARAVQGIGAAILAPSTLALLAANFAAGPERTRAVAWYGAVAGVGSSIGLVLGGVLADTLSWRVGFFINLPVGVALITAALRTLPETERRSGRFDIAGAVTSTLGMTALVYGIVRTATDGWGDAVTLGNLGAGAALLAVFVVIEGRARQPIMPLRLFAHRERAAAYAGRVLFLGAMMGFWFFITQYLQAVAGFTPFQAGLAFLPMTLPNFAVALIVPQLTRRFGNARLLAAGLAITMLGMLWLSRIAPGSGYVAAVALPMILIGIGQGCSLSPLTAAGIADVAPDDAGAASGLVNVTHQVGGSLGLGLLVALAALAMGGDADTPARLARGAAAALTGGAVMLAIALVLVFVLIVRPPSARR